jgi:hypothetical protein
VAAAAAPAIHSSPTCRPWPRSAMRCRCVGAAVLAMVAPMLMHAYTDATAAGQALIAAQFATMLQVGVTCHLAILGRDLAGSLVARDRVALLRRSASAIPLVAGTRSSRGRRQRRGVKSHTRCSDRVLFVLWTAWWISVLVVFARQTQASSVRARSTRGIACSPGPRLDGLDLIRTQGLTPALDCAGRRCQDPVDVCLDGGFTDHE